MGAMIARGPTLNKQVVELLAAAAEAEGIPHAFEVYTRSTATDADEFHLSRAGVPTALISIPMRYLHTPNELSALDDVEAAISLIVAAQAPRARRDLRALTPALDRVWHDVSEVGALSRDLTLASRFV